MFTGCTSRVLLFCEHSPRPAFFLKYFVCGLRSPFLTRPDVFLKYFCVVSIVRCTVWVPSSYLLKIPRNHHHHGVAENAIKIVVYKERTMMIHAAIRWSCVSEKDLCPMSLDHSTSFHSNILQMESGLSPEEIWTGNKSDYSRLRTVLT